MKRFTTHGGRAAARGIAYRVGLCAFVAAAFGAAPPRGAAEPAFRTDGGNPKLPWFQLKPGEFPPVGSAHAISGELIGVDHINRTGTIRLDRDDTQRRGEWDRPLAFTLLPYGSISFHGAPAELRDVPIGTHLHGQFYLEGKPARDGSGVFSHAFELEDDFSFAARRQHTWRVDAVALDTGTLTVTEAGPAADPGDSKPRAYQIAATTRVWKGRAIGSLEDLAAGQSVLLNLTVCTLKGPGRCTDIWLDPDSRQLATAHQLELHRQYTREHGLAGWVDAVDNAQGIVTVTLFPGFDPKMVEDFPVDDVVSAAVAEDSLRTWDQINDKKAGPIVEVLTAPTVPGGGGLRLRFKPSVLLEGYRPGRIVRLFCSKWKVDDLPREEHLFQ